MQNALVSIPLLAKGHFVKRARLHEDIPVD